MKRIIYDIEKYTIDDYTAIVDDFVDFFSSKYGNSISLYQIGSAGFPSLSDLDLAIIIDESKLNESTIRSIIKDANEFIYQNEARRYIFTHSTLKYPIQTFTYKQYFEYAPGEIWLHGEKVMLKTDEEDRYIIDEMMFILYGSNTMRNFERLHRKKSVSLRELLKVYQHAYYHLRWISYAQNDQIDSSKLLEMSEYAKQMRLEAIQKVFNLDQEAKLIQIFKELYDLVKSSYYSQMALLSKKITGEHIDKEIFVLGSGGIVKQPLFMLYMGALYGREFEKAGNCYSEIHKLMYPLDISHINFDSRYVKNIQKQAEILKSVCSFYKRFGVKVSGPLLCYYCQPNTGWKLKIRYTIQKVLYRLQGVKTV